MNLDIKDSYVRAKVRHMDSTWIANDALRIVERPDRTRMMRKFVVVGRWVREGEVDE
jgi:hypothetical protein